MKIAEDGFMTVAVDVRVGQVVQALDQVKGGGLPRPRYLVAQKPDGSIAGIVFSSTLDWAEPEERISDQADLDVVRKQVDLDAHEAEKAAAVNASDGLALGFKHGRLVAILRPAELGLDGRLPIGRREPAPEDGLATCPNCRQAYSQLLSLPRLGPERQVTYQRICPHCNWLISER